MARFVNWRNGFWALLLVSLIVTGGFVFEAGDQEVALKQCRSDAMQSADVLALLRRVAVEIAEPRSRDSFLDLMRRNRPAEVPAFLGDGSVHFGGLEFVFQGDRLVEIRD